MYIHLETKYPCAVVVIVVQISLTESLCGFDFTLKHLDNRILHLKSQPGKVSDGCIQNVHSFAVIRMIFTSAAATAL